MFVSGLSRNSRLTGAAAALALAVAVPGGASGATKLSCHPKKEAKGCKLPTGATYRAGVPGDYTSTVLQEKAGYLLGLYEHFDCSAGSLVGTSAGHNYPVNGLQKPRRSGRLVVGKSYVFNDTVSYTDPDTGKTTTKTVTATVKIVSATTATITYSLTRTTNGAQECQGGASARLKRTK